MELELNKWYKSEEIDDFKTKRVCYFKPEYVDDLIGFYQGVYVREVEYKDGDIGLDITQDNIIYGDETNKYYLIDKLTAQEEIHFIIEKTEEKLFY